MREVVWNIRLQGGEAVEAFGHHAISDDIALQYAESKVYRTWGKECRGVVVGRSIAIYGIIWAVCHRSTARLSEPDEGGQDTQSPLG